ncbi:MAG: hypothetical protein PVI86_12065 [Phycisphaerae bacterium]
MREFHTHRPPSGIRRHRTLAVTFGVLLVGGAAFAAVGGAETVKQFFFDVRVVIMGTDGAVHDAVVQLEQIDGEEGAAVGTIELGDGEEATIELKEMALPAEAGVDLPEGEEMRMMTISLAGMDADLKDGTAERTIELSAVMYTGDEPIEQNDVLEQIAEAEFTVPWTDSNGDDREVFIVREEGEDGSSVIKLFGSRWTGEGDEVFDMLGIVADFDSLIVEAPRIEIHKDRITSLTVVGEDGRKGILRLDRQRPNRMGDPPAVQVIIGESADE